MSWTFMPAHALSLIEPTLSVGSMGAAYAKGNINTLDPNIIASFDAGLGGAAQFRWDRGDTTILNTVSGVAFINHNFGAKGHAVTVYGGAAAGDTTDTLYTNALPTIDRPIFTTFSESSRRHIRLDIGTAAGTGYVCGVFTLGPAYDMGQGTYGSIWSTGSQGAAFQGTASGSQFYTGAVTGRRTVTVTFAKVLKTDALEMQAYHSFQYVPSGLVGSTKLHGTGGGGGQNPCVLKDNDGTVYYGPCTLSITDYVGQYARVTISMTEIPYPRHYLVP